MNALRNSRHRHDDLDVLVLEFGDIESVDARDELLIDGVYTVIAELVAVTSSAGVGVALDVRAPDDLGTSGAAHVEAFIAACHGIIHSFVAEERTEIVPVNLVVSGSDQDHDRNVTLAYLSSADGQFARGAAFDLRDAA